MAKLFPYNPTMLAEALRRIEDGTDHGNQVQRPDFDPRERRESEKEAANGRKAEVFHAVLERQGYTWWPAREVQARAVAAGTERIVMPGEAAPVTEGQWRNGKLRSAFTETDVLAMFQTPEDFARWARRRRRELRLMADPRVSKAERRIALARVQSG